MADKKKKRFGEVNNFFKSHRSFTYSSNLLSAETWEVLYGIQRCDRWDLYLREAYSLMARGEVHTEQRKPYRIDGCHRNKHYSLVFFLSIACK